MAGYEPRPQVAGYHFWQLQPVRDFLAIAAAAAVAVAVFRIRGVLMPALIGLFLAYIVEPAIKFLHVRLRIPRLISVAVMFVAGIACAVLVGVWLLPLVIHQGYALLQNAPDYLDNLARMALAPFGVPVEEALKNLQPQPQQLLSILGSLIEAASSLVFWVFLLPFFFFAFAWRFPAIVRHFECLIPRPHRHSILQVLRRIDTVFGNFFRGRLLVCISAGFFLSLGWFFAAVPYWFLVGMVTGLLGIAPYLSVLGWVAAVLFKYLSAGSGPADWIAVIFWPSAVFIGVNIIEEWMITPWIQSRAVNLSPVTIVIAVLVGGALAGVGGLLFAIPVAGALKIVSQELIMPRFRHLFG